MKAKFINESLKDIFHPKEGVDIAHWKRFQKSDVMDVIKGMQSSIDYLLERQPDMDEEEYEEELYELRDEIEYWWEEELDENNEFYDMAQEWYFEWEDQL